MASCQYLSQMPAPQLKLLFEQTGLTHAQVAEHCGCDVSTIYRWLRGDNNPNKVAVDLLQSLAQRRASGNRKAGKVFSGAPDE